MTDRFNVLTTAGGGGRMTGDFPAIRPLLLALIATGLFCRLMFAFFTPTFYAPDEVAHFNYIQHLGEQGAFPVMHSSAGNPVDETECHQPPLYYLAMAPLFRAAQALLPDQHATVIFLRLFSVLLWLLNVWLGGIWLSRLQIKDRFIRVFVMAVICLLPTYTFTSAAINNDNLLLPLGTGLFCLMAGRRQSLKYSLGLGLLLGLALLTKHSAVVFVPVIAWLTVGDYLRQRVGWTSGWLHLGIIFGLAGLMYLPWGVRNWQTYGTLHPELLSLAPAATPSAQPVSGSITPKLPVAEQRVWPSMAYGMASSVHNLVKTFWAVSGVSNNVGYPFPLAGMALLLLAGSLPFITPKPEPPFADLMAAAHKPLMAVWLVAIGINIVLALRFGYMFGMGQGRHLFPVLYPIALLLAGGLRRLPAKNRERLAAGFWMAYAVSFMVYSLVRFP